MSLHLILPETVPILCGVYCMLEERQAGTTHWLNCTPCTEYYVGRKGRLVQATTGLALSPVQNVMLKERPFFTSHWLNFTPCSKCHVGGEVGDYNVLAKQYTLHMLLLEERQTCITHIDLDTIYEE